MLRKIGMMLCLAAAAAIAPQVAQASCTANITCSNSCAEHLECTSGVVISCSAPAKAISCSGASACSSNATSVTCDGVATNCQPASARCAKDAVSIRCDATFKSCPTCGGKVCDLASPKPFEEEPVASPVETEAKAACF